MSITQTTKNVYFDGGDRTTLSDWTAYVSEQYASGTPIIIIFPLETTIEESAPLQLLNNPSGDSIILRESEINNLGMSITLKVKK